MTLSFEDSEIWGITSSQRIFHCEQFWSSAWFKPIFSILLGAVTKISPDNWSTLVFARLLAWLFSIGVIFATSMLMPHRFRNPLLILTVLSPIVVLNLSKVRSDLFSVASALLTLIWLFDAKLALQKRLVIFFLGCTTTLLFTPKSLDLYFVLLIALFQSWPTTPTQRRQTLIAAVSPIAGVFLILLLFSRGTLFRIVNYASDSYRSTDFFSYQNWLYVYEMARTGPLVVTAIAIGLISAARNFRNLRWQMRSLFLGSLTSLSYTLLAPQKLPFLLSSRLPLWMLGASVGFQFFSFRSIRRQHLDLGQNFIIILGIGISAVLWFRSPIRHFEMSIQKESYVKLDRSIEELGPRSYWDAIGLFPQRNQLFHYPSPGDSSNNEVFDAIVESKPSLILETSKVKLLGPEFEHWLRTNYVEIGINIWTLRSTIEPSVACRWPSALLLEQATKAGLRPPLALVTSNPMKDLFAQRWIRIPFYFENGAESDSLSEKLPWSISAADCSQTFALTEAAPWTLSETPDISILFGFQGIL